MSKIRESFLKTVEEFLRTTDQWEIDWIEGYYNILSKDFLREFKHHLNTHIQYDEVDHIWHTFGEQFAIEIYGREEFFKFKNRIEFRNETA